MSQVRLGIIGCGVIGRQHLTSARALDDVETVALCDIDPEIASAAAAEFGVGTSYTDPHELLADDRIEAVVIGLPAGVRQPVVLAAFAAGKHVLTEKPIGMNSAQVRELIAARGSLIAGCCSSRNRQLESSKVATEYIASGRLGALRLVRGRGVNPAPARPEKSPPPWRLNRSLNGGGIMANWGCYDLDYLLGITGWKLRPETVFAQTWPVSDNLADYVAPGSDAETHAVALVRCADGIALTLERGEYLPVAREDAWQVIGTRGSLRLCMLPRRPNTVYLEAHDETGTSTSVLWQGDEVGDTMRQGIVRDFAAAVREQRAPMTSLEQALIVQQITDGIYESARTGTAVSLTAEG
jgi:predicted dehydrogenase